MNNSQKKLMDINNANANVLIIDDRSENLRFLSKILSDEGYTVRPSNNGPLALESIKKRKPDLILLDIKMPGMDGYEVCRQLKKEEQTREIPIIFLSALDEPLDKIRAFDLGGVDYITKPIQSEELLARVRTHLKLYWMHSRLEHIVHEKTAELANTNAELQNKIDDLKTAGNALQESEGKYRTLFADGGDAIFIVEVDPENRPWFRECNQRTLSLFGCESNDIIGKSPELFSPETQPDGISSHEKAIELSRLVIEGKPQHFQWLHHRYDTREPFWVEVTLTRLTLGGKSNYMQSVVRDITERKQHEKEKVKLEAQLRQTQKMEAIGTLAGGIAHDFNNILAAVFGFTELAMSHAEKGSMLANHLDEVMSAARRAKDLVKQILTFSRQSEQELKPVQIKLVTKEALKLLRASLPTTIKIHQNIKSDSLVMSDPTQIHQIIMNLCTNAGHAMQSKGGVLSAALDSVELDSEFEAMYQEIKQGPYVQLTISDTGHGMTQEIIDRIFDPFYTTKEKGEGTGMGLSVVHGIVKSYGGAINVYSEQGKGSTFKIFLPAIEKRLEPEARFKKPIPKGTESILFVDDEAPLIKMGKQLLESLGYEVTTNTSSIEALNLFKTNPEAFDLVISDMTMPNMTGDELAQKLMGVRPDIPVIICTGFSENITEKKAKTIGIRGLVSKPTLKRDLAEIIRKVLDENDEV